MDRFVCRAGLLALGMCLATSPAASETGTEALTAMLQKPVVACGAARLDGQRLTPYYPVPIPLWIDEHGPNARARLLRSTLKDAGREGLEPARYRVAEIEAHWDGARPDAQACLELLLTAAFDRYARDQRRGRVGPHEADPSWFLRPEAFDPVAALQAAASVTDFSRLLESLPPAHAAYARLRAALARYRQFAERGGWPDLPAGPKLEPGAEHAQVHVLRARLKVEGDLPALALSFGARYDRALVAAVQRFQQRHGLRPDGIIGARTRAALNLPAAERAAQLRRAMERLRWLPRALGEHYVLVNTAGFELTVIEHGQTVLAMRTINGTPDQATPSFTATLQTLVINPYWYVPERIAQARLWPRARRDPGYLARHGFRVFDTRNGWQELDPAQLDWARIDAGDSGVRLRQEPGPNNLMGRLSFVFPNPYDVFLHDTPERALFERDTRTFSEGCVRIEHAVALALHTLRRAPEWSETRLRKEIDSLRHLNLPLPEPIPVYVLYLSAWVDDDGRVQFRADSYGRERVLAGYFPPSD